MPRILRYTLWTLTGLVAVPVAAIGLFALWAWIYFSWHYETAATRKAIYAESQVLMHGNPDKVLIRIRLPALPGGRPFDMYEPRNVPQVITSLNPLGVDVGKDGVSIDMRIAFDDGCGYFVPRDKSFDPRRKGYFGLWTQIGDGVWWFHTY